MSQNRQSRSTSILGMLLRRSRPSAEALAAAAAASGADPTLLTALEAAQREGGAAGTGSAGRKPGTGSA